MRKTQWMKLEEVLMNDAFSAFYELEMRRALLDSGRFPPLREKLEEEIAHYEKRFDEVGPLYLTAQKHANADRAKQAEKEVQKRRSEMGATEV